MPNPLNIVEPPEKVIEEIEDALIRAIADANQQNRRLNRAALESATLSSSTLCFQHVQSLQFAQDLIKRGLDRRIAIARRHQNALQWVNKLPDEILSMVFQQVLATTSIFNRHTTLFTILGVSDQWRRVINSTPSLWCFVTPCQSPAQMEQAISKSSQLPLSIGFRALRNHVTMENKLNSQAFLRAMRETGRAWDELILHLPTVSHVKEFIESPMPFLRKLEIKGTRHVHHLYNLMGGQAPLLEDITLKRVYIKWDNNIFSGLRRLDLDYVGVDWAGPKATQLLDIVERSPGLQSLSFSCTSFHPRAASPIRPIIVMPHHTTISLKNIDAEDAIALLAAIMAPSCNRFTLHCERVQDYDHVLLVAEPFVRSASKFLQQPELISICLGSSHFHYHADSSSCKLDIKFALGTQPYKPLQWLSSIVHANAALNSPVTIRFDPRFDFTRDNSLFDSLSQLRYTTSVKIADRTVGPCRLLEWLSTPMKNQFPLVKLTHLVLGQSNLLVEDVVSFVLKRYKNSAARSPGSLESLVMIGTGWTKRLAPELIQSALPYLMPDLKYSEWEDKECELGKVEGSDVDCSLYCESNIYGLDESDMYGLDESAMDFLTQFLSPNA